MKAPLVFLLVLIAGAISAESASFVTVTDVSVNAAGGSGPTSNSEDTSPSGLVTKRTSASFAPPDPVAGDAASARVDFLADDLGAFFSVQLITSSPPAIVGSSCSAEAAITFQSTKPLLITRTNLIEQGSRSLTFDNEEGVPTATVPAGTHTIRMAVTNATANANFGVNFEIVEDTDSDPGPDPDPDPTPGTLRWKSYKNGFWQDGLRWDLTRAPVRGDSLVFDLLPDAAARTVPLPKIAVNANASKTVKNLSIARSHVEFRGFDLTLTASDSTLDSLIVRDGATVRVNSETPGSRVRWKTAGVGVGNGRAVSLGKKKVLDTASFIVGRDVTWADETGVGVGVRMNGLLQVETVEPGQPGSFVNGLVAAGLAKGVTGTISVPGQLGTGDLTLGAANGAAGTLFVFNGGRMDSEATVLGDKTDSFGAVLVDDQPSLEESDFPPYTSLGRLTSWFPASLDMSGQSNNGAGSPQGGNSSLTISSGGDVRTERASLGNVNRKTKAVAEIAVAGFDPADREPSTFTVFGPLAIGVRSPASVSATFGGLISAGGLAIKGQGKLRVGGLGRDDASAIVSNSSVSVVDDETQVFQPASVDGGGMLLIDPNGIFVSGDLTLGGVTPKKRQARFRVDATGNAAPGNSVEVGELKIGNGRDFPALFEMLEASVLAGDAVNIDIGSTVSGFGRFAFADVAPSKKVINAGRILVPPGNGKQLRIEGDFEQTATGRTTLFINKTNLPSEAPLVVTGTTVNLTGVIEVRFAGGRKPASGEAFNVLSAETATIVNNGTVVVTGVRKKFDLVQDDSGLVIVFR